MNQIQLWQLLVDLGLVTSVLVMTVKALKVSRIPSMLPQTRELEASLRTLIGEAEQSGFHLNDQLLRREQNIQRSLAEMQATEQRLTSALAEAETLQGKLKDIRAEIGALVQDLKCGFQQGVQIEQTRAQSSGASSVETISPARSEAIRGERPVSLKAPTTAQRGGVSDEFVEDSVQRSVSTPQSRQHTAQPTKTAKAYQSATQAGAPMNDLKQVYASAESMIKEGQALESVASQMKLPVEGVRLLAQMIEIERDEGTRRQDPAAKTTTTDSRLGALASGRRTSTVI
jgi:hypothetical protein